MKHIKIIGIHVLDRIKEAQRAQAVLSEFSHLIATRLGFHELTKEVSSRKAFMLLKLKGDPAKWISLEKRLSEIGGIEVRTMDFKV
jgi:hypothetical protein